MSTHTTSVMNANLVLQTVEGGGLRFDARTGNAAFTLDSGPEVTSPTPLQVVLAATGGCTGMDVISILEKKRQNITAFEVRVHGERAERDPKKFTSFLVEYVVTGKGIDPNAVERAVELSETKYCTVMATLRCTGPIERKIQIREG